MPIRRTVVLAAGVLLSVGGCADGSGSDESTTGLPAEAPHQAEMSTYTSEYGIRLSIARTYPEDRVLTTPSVRVGDVVGDGHLWPRDGVDHESEDLDPLSLPAGTEVLYEVTVKPDCRDDVEESPKIQFAIPGKSPGGRHVVDTLVPSNPEAYEPAFRLWCDVGVTLQAGGGSLTREDGRARVALLINNAGPHEILVEMPALSSGGATWQELAATVPAGRSVTRIVEGSGVRCDSDQEVPWADGRIIVNGKPLSVPVADAWC